VGTTKDGPAKLQRLPINGESYGITFHANIISNWEHPVATVANSGHVTEYHPQQKLLQNVLTKCYLLQDSWFDDPTCLTMMSEHLILDTWDLDAYYFNDIPDPRLLAAQAKVSKYNKDNPSFDTGTRGPFQAQFWQVMRMELHTLINKFDCWDYLLNPGTNVLPSIWAFKTKCYLDGCVKKFKACFCARGDRQTKGVGFFETWAPVVMWSTVCIMMVLAATLDLISVQCDITAAFIHACVPATETMHVH
jgi:hypothetical protein